MPRGRRKIVIEDTIEAAISQKQAEREAVFAEITSAQSTITEAKAVLKTKRAELKKIDHALVRLEEQKTAKEFEMAEAEKKAKVTEAVEKLINSGFSMDDILKLLDD